MTTPTEQIRTLDGAILTFHISRFSATPNWQCEECGETIVLWDDREELEGHECEYQPACPVCGSVIDFCQGHGDIGDPTGYAILQAHDDDNHADCHPEGCEEVQQ